MALSLADIRKRAAEAAKTGPDYNEQKSGGGDYKPPEEGFVKLRLVGYIESGLHTTESARFGKKTKPRATLIFELSGKKHEPKTLDDGRQIPHIIEVKEPIGQNKKNNFSKLFKEMVKEYPDRKNFGEMVGEAFTGRVVHRKFKRRDGTDGVIAELKNEAGYTISGVTYEQKDEDGEVIGLKKYKVDEPLSPLRLFLWDYADLEQWDSLFIDGTYDNGDSKNKYQEYIKEAENIGESPLFSALLEAGREEELVPAPKHARDGAAQPEPEPETPAGSDEEDEPEQEGPAEAPSKPVAPAKTTAKATPAPAKKTAPAPAKVAATKAPVKPVKKAAPVVDEEDDDADPLAGL